MNTASQNRTFNSLHILCFWWLNVKILSLCDSAVNFATSFLRRFRPHLELAPNVLTWHSYMHEYIWAIRSPLMYQATSNIDQTLHQLTSIVNFHLAPPLPHFSLNFIPGFQWPQVWQDECGQVPCHSSPEGWLHCMLNMLWIVAGIEITCQRFHQWHTAAPEAEASRRSMHYWSSPRDQEISDPFASI